MCGSIGSARGRAPESASTARPSSMAAYQAAVNGTPAPRPGKGSLKGSAGVAARAVPGLRGMGCAICGDPPAAREHLQARSRDGRQSTRQRHHSEDDTGRSRATRQDAIASSATSWTPCAGCSNGRPRPSTSSQTRPPGWSRLPGPRPRASRLDRGRRSANTRHAGRSALRSGSGWTCCSIRACAAATPCC
jgi:hypothetical protein